MKYGVILPHTLLFGGVKRFLEIGNIFVQRGDEFIVFTPAGAAADWFDFRGTTLPLSELRRHTMDVLFICETEFLPQLLESNSKLKIFYQTSQKSIAPVLRHPEVHVFANSTTIYNYLKRRHGIKPVKVFGGVDTKRFFPKPYLRKPSDPFTVLTFGRLSRKKKGIPIIVKACERLHRKGYNIRLLFYDTPIDEKSTALYKAFTSSVPFEFVLNHPVMDQVQLFHRADVYLCAESGTGWSNPSIEAMASGVPVIGTTSGTSDFLIDEQTGLVVWRNRWSFSHAIKKLIDNPETARTMAENALLKIQEFTWEQVVRKIDNFVQNHFTE